MLVGGLGGLPTKFWGVLSANIIAPGNFRRPL